MASLIELAARSFVFAVLIWGTSSWAMIPSSLHSTKVVETKSVAEAQVAENDWIVKAIDQNNQAIVVRWLANQHSAVTRIKNKMKEHLLDRAASHGSVQVFEALLASIHQHAQVVKYTDGRGTPLIISLASLATGDLRYEKMIEILLKYAPTQINAADHAYIGDGRTALHQASANGNTRLVKFLIAHGAKINLKKR